ncbi:hypothetical protein Cob_v006745 [Colletotrichum orbiculare MAFF 240422]|uniref:Uncharacterized protein n=1 Tax=Colletotrichum orbiculare (strain 104-T / ATCC 96160 / CBS 514.97 / LARS 414 / MAFF 240422) TaxID=1213857 RepID=A0A484FRD7_COLOR|nr:hypothetical protein Cob_v006745 [Colletotrichum orbiculare MAFF 240422]
MLLWESRAKGHSSSRHPRSTSPGRGLVRHGKTLEQMRQEIRQGTGSRGANWGARRCRWGPLPGLCWLLNRVEPAIWRAQPPGVATSIISRRDMSPDKSTAFPCYPRNQGKTVPSSFNVFDGRKDGIRITTRKEKEDKW